MSNIAYSLAIIDRDKAIEDFNYWFKQLLPEEIKAKRIMRGHRRKDCKCRYCSIPLIDLSKSK